jgi:pyrimidine operon attenuation protein/uracil phosphoribosyltransferase
MASDENQSQKVAAEAVAVKTVNPNWIPVLDADYIRRATTRIAYEILEHDRGESLLAVVGIRTCGEFVAKRIYDKLLEIEPGLQLGFGVIDITLYRDDLSQAQDQPTLRGTDLPFRISGSRIILVDDVLYTGRTVRAALDAIVDFGRPRCVELAVIADRGHRELPIRPDYVGKNIPTDRSDFVRLRLSEFGYEDALYIAPGRAKQVKK